jgi:hypothetical protein
VKTILDFAPDIQKALDIHGTHSVADVAEMILSGELRAFWSDNAMLAVSIQRCPKATVLDYWLAVGDLGEIKELLPQIEEWGREQGCTVAHMGGRHGWKPVLKRLGWDTRYVSMRKDLV